jgi:hypothetical protein
MARQALLRGGHGSAVDRVLGSRDGGAPGRDADHAHTLRRYFDEDDVRYLLRYLNIESFEAAVAVITRYYPLERFPQKTLYALEELL